MKVTSPEEFEQLTQPTTGSKKRVVCYATLTPAIAAAFQETKMAPSILFMAALNHTKTSGNTQGGNETEDILKDMGEPYYDLLLLL